MLAPFNEATAAAARLPPNRLAGSSPVMRPMNFLRDAPMSTGRPAQRSSLVRSKISRLCRSSFPNPIPGSG